jgi:hypothetical protein
LTPVLGGMHEQLASYYSEGRPSIDPELMVRMLIVGYCYAFARSLICRVLPVPVYNHTLSSGDRLLGQAQLAKYPKRDESNKRQADHILAAFRYQLLHSLDAWVNLRQGEILWLEIEEDYSVAGPGGTTDVQVKRSPAAAGPTPRSFHSADVR